MMKIQRSLLATVLLGSSFILTSCLSNSTHTTLLDDLRIQTQQKSDKNGRVTPQLQKTFYEFEDRYFSKLDKKTQTQFQQLVGEVGGKVHGKIILPESQTPFWHMSKGELEDYQSSKTLPDKANIVIIGAGLTGASAAYHLSQQAAKGLQVVLLESERQPASLSSGRNGGNFQLLPESYVDNYEGLIKERLKWLRKINKNLSEDQLYKKAKAHAETLVNFSFKNFKRFRSVVSKENLDCDFSEGGWLRIASSPEEEKILQEDTEWMLSYNQKDMPDIELWSPQKVKEKLGVESQYGARYIAKNGNYHPYKFVTALLKKTITNGVHFYTGTRVTKILPVGEKYRVSTGRGDIIADKVIVATNVKTTELFPNLPLYTVYSQIMNLEHTSNTLNGFTLTERRGDYYYNFPASKSYTDAQGIRRGMVHLGLDFSEPSIDGNRSEQLFHEMKALTDMRFPETKGQPASRVWTGPMAFTDDRVPMIGFMNSKNLILAVAFQGYGGSYCIQAGYVASEMALKGVEHRDAPASVFSPTRTFQKVSVASEEKMQGKKMYAEKK
jgi:glycine/D-amino acid oxidase-like deaminating enzyme